MTHSQLDFTHARLKLTEERAQLADRLERLHADRTHAEGPVAQSFAEQSVERANDDVVVALEQATAAELRQVEDALARMDEGRYGNCVRCGGPIGEARLLALVAATSCAACAALAEASLSGAPQDRCPNMKANPEPTSWHR